MKSLTASEAKSKLLELVEALEKDVRGVLNITRGGRRVATLISAEMFDAIVESLAILGDPAAMIGLRRGVREIASGKGIPLKDARRRLGL